MNQFISPESRHHSVAQTAMSWLKTHLFSSWLNAVITVALLYLLVLALLPFVQWAFINASFSGTSAADCAKDGACWVFITNRLDFFIYGAYPVEEHWRVNILYVLLALIIIPQFFNGCPKKIKLALGIFGLTLYPVLAFFLMAGAEFLNLVPVETARWGGLTLTLILAYVGMVAAIPLGTLLALGRRSNMPIIKAFCVTFIEFWRGVPLITILFMASVMLPLFMPEGLTLDRLLRALIGIMLFQSAYMAEVIRAGLQAIPRGQYEAADALGLGYWQGMGLVVLPQALKIVIPGIVNTLIALFKDTSLVLTVGLFDLLNTIQNTIIDPAWSSVAMEGYLFAGLAYWIFCFGMSRYSQKLERQLHTGHKV